MLFFNLLTLTTLFFCIFDNFLVNTISMFAALWPVVTAPFIFCEFVFLTLFIFFVIGLILLMTNSVLGQTTSTKVTFNQLKASKLRNTSTSLFFNYSFDNKFFFSRIFKMN